jgi:phage shock protein C
MKQLKRSSEDVNISGVCAGIAEYLQINSTWIRITFTLAAVLTGFVPGIVTYILLIRIIPENPLRNPIEQPAGNQKKKNFNDSPLVPHG